MPNQIQNLKIIKERIDTALKNSGRDSAEVQLIWVSKNHPKEAVIEARSLGAKHFGENRVQEALTKFKEKPEGEVLHIIGPIQSNKLRKAIVIADWIHTVDSISQLEKISRIAQELKKEINILFQINTSGETSKSGIPLSEAKNFLEILKPFPNVAFRGLMTIPSAIDEALYRREFKELKILLDSFKNTKPEFVSFDKLSMGMSGDLEMAIEEGAHFIRVGTALFGQRDYTL